MEEKVRSRKCAVLPKNLRRVRQGFKRQTCVEIQTRNKKKTNKKSKDKKGYRSIKENDTDKESKVRQGLKRQGLKRQEYLFGKSQTRKG